MFWTIILVYIGFGVYLFIAQRSIIYYPNFLTESNFYNCPAFDDSEKLNINGTRAYYKHTGERIVIIYHGNAGSACDRDYLKSAIENAGYSYLFVEYTGYGGDGNKPSREVLLKDAENTISFLREKNYKETVLFSESIGAGVASYHASLLPPNKMILISPFDSLANIAKSKFPFYVYPVLLMTKFSKENYDNIPLLQSYEGDLLVIHGAKDDMIPLRLGRALYDKVPTSNKKFISIEDAGHNDIYNFDKTWNEISRFLSWN